MAVKTDKNKCLRCGGCVGVCPQVALDLTEHGLTCDPKKCVDCGICVNFCPVEALSLKK
ncbi:MAG: 4Fe-4S dicluster domain-containing protein [Candidatus Aenigmarchaeota archaeon]|nr:4Fe-4S dicluster domain-containing protein [Candidatus Aenigmarchaeota archaeon]